MADHALLFVALGEAEAPAFAAVARALRDDGIRTRVVTWLPRLADGRHIECLATLPAREARIGALKAETTAAGIAVPAMAADYDPDWHFAPVIDKAQHVHAVHAALTTVFDEFRPTHLISSTGAETTRVIADAIAAARGVNRLYFSDIPAAARFVLLPTLDAPFVPWTDDGRPRPSGIVGGHVPARPVHRPQPPATGWRLVAEGATRAAELTMDRHRVYPRGWLRRTVGARVRDRALNTARRSRVNRDTDDTLVLYPLHDERDFQLAVRERHALPQSSLLSYVSSVLPPGYRLMIKPHPDHRAAHHPRLWRDVAQRANVTMLDFEVSTAEAIDAADVVLTVASSLGYQALLAGKPVVCYGQPFYGGRGLTIDVEDPRDIAESLSKAIGFLPDEQALHEFGSLLDAVSWPGRFSPLDLDAANLGALRAALLDALRGR